jgi:2-polyprenyl-6-methoxyphenol hydroxylase-like FAD-dependent oxidoreductase
MPLHHITRRQSYEVVVVGARCAGATTAMLLAREGVDVVVLDRAKFPSDTLSTHAIARGGVVQLSRWGLLEEVIASGAPPIRTVAFHFPGGDRFRDVKDTAGVDHLLAPRRHILDMILLAAAQTAGASVQTGVTVTGTLTDPSGRVAGVTIRDRDGTNRDIRACFVIGADGVRSRIARSVTPRVIEVRSASGTIQYAYVAGLDGAGFEFHVGPGSLSGVFPTHGGEANVWLCTPSDGGRLARAPGDRTDAFLHQLERSSASLAARVREARLVSPVRRADGLPNHVLEAVGPGWALVGDAGYHRDPITGHGITDAFRDAELLSRQLAGVIHGDVPETLAMAAYADERYRALAPIFELTWRLSGFPPPGEFIELQKRLSSLLDAEASWLAALPPVREACGTAAA